MKKLAILASLVVIASMSLVSFAEAQTAHHKKHKQHHHKQQHHKKSHHKARREAPTEASAPNENAAAAGDLTVIKSN